MANMVFVAHSPLGAMLRALILYTEYKDGVQSDGIICHTILASAPEPPENHVIAKVTHGNVAWECVSALQGPDSIFQNP